MNVVYRKNGKRPLNRLELHKALCKLITEDGYKVHPEILENPYFVEDRIKGELCACLGKGVFELLPLEECLIKNGGGGKYYMKCRKCGEVSHL